MRNFEIERKVIYTDNASVFYFANGPWAHNFEIVFKIIVNRACYDIAFESECMNTKNKNCGGCSMASPILLSEEYDQSDKLKKKVDNAEEILTELRKLAEKECKKWLDSNTQTTSDQTTSDQPGQYMTTVIDIHGQQAQFVIDSGIAVEIDPAFSWVTLETEEEEAHLQGHEADEFIRRVDLLTKEGIEDAELVVAYSYMDILEFKDIR